MAIKLLLWNYCKQNNFYGKKQKKLFNTQPFVCAPIHSWVLGCLGRLAGEGLQRQAQNMPSLAAAHWHTSGNWRQPPTAQDSAAAGMSRGAPVICFLSSGGAEGVVGWGGAGWFPAIEPNAASFPPPTNPSQPKRGSAQDAPTNTNLDGGKLRHIGERSSSPICRLADLRVPYQDGGGGNSGPLGRQKSSESPKIRTYDTTLYAKRRNERGCTRTLWPHNPPLKSRCKSRSNTSRVFTKMSSGFPPELRPALSRWIGGIGYEMAGG